MPCCTVLLYCAVPCSTSYCAVLRCEATLKRTELNIRGLCWHLGDWEVANRHCIGIGLGGRVGNGKWSLGTKLAAGNWPLETGCWKLVTGNWDKIIGIDPFCYVPRPPSHSLRIQTPSNPPRPFAPVVFVLAHSRVPLSVRQPAVLLQMPFLVLISKTAQRHTIRYTQDINPVEKEKLK
jgi:hypothetical protein